MPDKKQLYQFFKKNNFTQKSEEEFLNQYSDSSEAKKLHSFMQKNEFTKKDFDSFYGDYFGGTAAGGETQEIGGNINIPESSRISYVHNNPGNLMYIGQEGAQRGEPKKGGGYWAKFESPQEGYQSLIKDIQSKQQGKTSTGLKPESTLVDFFNVYAPPSENDTQDYISTVAESLGVSPDTPIGELDSTELARVVARQESGTDVLEPVDTSERIVKEAAKGAPPEELSAWDKVYNSLSNTWGQLKAAKQDVLQAVNIPLSYGDKGIAFLGEKFGLDEETIDWLRVQYQRKTAFSDLSLGPLQSLSPVATGTVRTLEELFLGRSQDVTFPEKQAETVERATELRGEPKETGNILEGAKDISQGNVAQGAKEIAAGVADGVLGFVPSLAVGLATGGAGFVPWVIGGELNRSVEQEALMTDRQIKEVFEQGDANVGTSVFVGTATGLLEKYGFTKLTKYLGGRELGKSFSQRFARMAKESGRQGLINWLEAGLMRYSEEFTRLSSGEDGLPELESHEQSAMNAANFLISEDGVEAGIKAMAGSFVLGSGKFVGTSFAPKNNAELQQVEIGEGQTSVMIEAQDGSMVLSDKVSKEDADAAQKHLSKKYPNSEFEVVPVVDKQGEFVEGKYTVRQTPVAEIANNLKEKEKKLPETETEKAEIEDTKKIQEEKSSQKSKLQKEKDGRTDDARRQEEEMSEEQLREEKKPDTLRKEPGREETGQAAGEKSERVPEATEEAGKTGEKVQAQEAAEQIIPATELSKARDTYQKTIKDKNQTQESALDGAWKRIARTQWYKGLGKEQQQQAETEFRNVRAEQIVNPARATKRKTREKLPSQKPVKKKETSKDKLTGKMVEKEVEVSPEKVVKEMQVIKDRVTALAEGFREGGKDVRKKLTEAKNDLINEINAELKRSSVDDLRRSQATQLLNKVKKANEKNIVKVTDEAIDLVKDFRERSLVKQTKGAIEKELKAPVVKKEHKKKVGKTAIPVQHYISKAKAVWDQMKLFEKQANITKEGYVTGAKGKERKEQEVLYEQHQAESLRRKQKEFNDYVEREIEIARKKQESDNLTIKEEGIYEEVALTDVRNAFNAGSDQLVDILANINRTVKEGKNKFIEKVEKDTERRKEIKEEAIAATENVYSGLNEAELRKKKASNAYKAASDFMKEKGRDVGNWTYRMLKTSLEYSLKYIESGNYRMQSGPLYERFFMSDNGYMDVRSNRYRDHDLLFGEIKGKFKEITGKASKGSRLAILSDPKSKTGIRIKKQDNPFNLSENEVYSIDALTKDTAPAFIDKLLKNKELKGDQRRDLKEFKAVISDSKSNKSERILEELKNALEGRDSIDEIMSKAEALYIYSAMKMDGVMENYERQGFDKKAIEQLKKFAGKDLIEFADRMQSDFLPNLHKNKYDPKHQEIYNAPLDFIKNYFPLIYDESGLVNKTKDLNIGEFSFFMPSATPNHLKSRIANLQELSRTANYFDVLFNYVESMEKWYHYSSLTKDFNTMISEKEFVNNINRGDSKSLKNLISAFERATEQYHGEMSDVDVFIANATRGVAGANISFRGWTGMKQTASAPAWLEKAAPAKVMGKIVPLLGGAKFAVKMIANMANPIKNYLNHKRFYKESAFYKRRIDERDAGYEDMHQGFMAVKSANRQIKKGALGRYLLVESGKIPMQIGMSLNVFMDAYTIAAGGRVYYNQQFKDYRKIMGKEEAHKKAIRDFDVAFNQVQQSAEGAFLAEVQANKTAGKALFTVYKTAQFGYIRKFMEGSIDLAGGYKRERNKWEQKYKSQGFGSELAEKKARRKGFNYLKTQDAWDDIKKMILYGWVIPLAWEYVTSGFPGLLTKWDEDDESKMKRALFFGPVDYTFAFADLAKVAYDRLVLGKKWYQWEPSVLVSEINDLLRDMSKALEESGETNKHVAREVIRVMLVTRGVDIENIGNIYEGAAKLIEDGKWTKEAWFKLMSAPKSFSEEEEGEIDDSGRPISILNPGERIGGQSSRPTPIRSGNEDRNEGNNRPVRIK